MSRLAFWLCAALLTAASLLYYPKWKMPGTEATISWDVSGYYLYLPGALIHHDLKRLEWWGETEREYNPGPGMGGAFQHPSGNYVMKYPMGQALQFLPWFTAAHLLAEPLGYRADGFSLPYQAAISWGSLLVAFIGLWFFRRSLLEYFPDRVVAATLICMVFGTNYLEYASMTGAMTHNWLFTLYALLIFSTIRFYRQAAFGWAALIGLLVGWATLTRPTEIISALIPLLWGVDSRAAWRARLAFLGTHFSKMALAAAVAGVVIFLQPAYWHYATGEWIVYSYQDQGFSWLKPHFSDVLFSARAGWLIYSPMMVFAVLGFFCKSGYTPLGKMDASAPAGPGLPGRPGIVLLLFCLLALYITAAWDIWWYGGSLGQRAMVQAYPLWAFPLAAFWQWVGNRGRILAGVVTVLAGACIYLNLWWSHQAHRGGLFVSEQMTKRYMLKILGRFEAERDWLKLLDTKEEFKGAERKEVREILFNDFETDSTASADAPLAGTRSLVLNAAQQFTPEFPLPLAAGQAGWLRASVTFRCEPKEWNWWQMTQFAVRFRNGDKMVKECVVRLQRHVDGGELKTLFFDTRIPEQPFDRATVMLWNAGSDKTVRLDDLRVEMFAH